MNSRFRLNRIKIDFVPGTYVKEFDGWRGVGIIFVVAAHYVPNLFMGSWIFMEMFFVMSGFLITGILMDSKNKKGYYKRFMYRRVLRVFPLYYLSLILLFFIIPNSWIDLSYYRQNQAWFWLYQENWLFSLEGLHPSKALNHFWSLAIEEQFYIVWPLFVLIFSTKSLIRFCIFLFFFSILFRNTGTQLGFLNPPFPYMASLGRMEGIVLGGIIAALVRTDKSILEKIAYPITIISGILSFSVFCYARTMHMDYSINYQINYTLVDIFFSGMIVLTLCKSELILLKKIFNIPLISKLGIMSYCIYIFHHPIHVITNYNFLDFFIKQTGNESLGKLICVFIAFCITVPVVYVIHKKVEIPFWKLKNATRIK